MKDMKLRTSVLAVIATLGLAGCSATDDTQTSTAPGTTTGVITGFGSVFVDGVEYETTGTSFSLDGTPGDESGLAVGMVVTLEGSVNADGTTGVATSIVFNDDVEGIVVSNTLASGGTLNIMGQMIHVSADTVFENETSNTAILTPADIPVDYIVEVSGHTSGDGNIYATRLEVKKAFTAGDEIEVKGVIKTVDIALQTLTIGNLVVDYSGADTNDLPGGVPAVNQYVEVKSTDGIIGGELIASKVELEGDGEKGMKGDEGEELKLYGVVTSVTGLPASFELNGQTVSLNLETEFDHGTIDSIVEGAKVKVEARFDTDGTTLIAEEVEFAEESDIELSGMVEAVDTTAKTVTVMGQTFTLTNSTIMMDEEDDGGVVPERYFDIADLVVGDYVEVKAYRNDADQLMATKLERDDVKNTVELEGYVTQASPLQVEGISVDVSGSSTPFFTASLGDKVEVKGTYTGGVLTVIEISLDD